MCLAIICEGTPTETPEKREKRQMSMTSAILNDQTPAPTQTPPFQGLPIIGALIPANLLGSLGGGAGGNTGGLGGLGSLLNLNLGGILPGLGLPQTQQNQCPIGQVSRCRCEPVIPLNQRIQDTLEILQQKVTLNINGDKEISARLNNGLFIYQRSGHDIVPPSTVESPVTQGYFTLKLNATKYLSIYYTITNGDYTVKADVTDEPPKNDLDESPQPLIF
ncbi:uncharacterized protein [Musca autumnalis]|uniref:uncharacterized protein n=1 Tax=Musca autumnalis TaxID=221902 RepID=UPI003CEADCBE